MSQSAQYSYVAQCTVQLYCTVQITVMLISKVMMHSAKYCYAAWYSYTAKCTVQLCCLVPSTVFLCNIHFTKLICCAQHKTAILRSAQCSVHCSEQYCYFVHAVHRVVNLHCAVLLYSVHCTKQYCYYVHAVHGVIKQHCTQYTIFNLFQTLTCNLTLFLRCPKLN